MSNKIELGKIISGPKPDKDATHVAVAPCCAKVSLQPGERVLVSDCFATPCANGPCTGIVDPFLQTFVGQYQWFWLFLLPNTAQNLRHEWDHPAFPKPEPEDSSEVEYNGCRGC